MMQDNSTLGDDGETHAQRASNLARIRDNQRRSRARRKEYLQELESRYRACEQMGVEASAEIQSAARKVVEENRKLRQLLKQTGMSDAEIDAMLGDERGLDSSQPTNNASNLESLLGVKRSCGSASSCSPSQSSDSARHNRSSKPSSLSDQSVHGQPPQHSPLLLPAPQMAFPVSQHYSARPTPMTSRSSTLAPSYAQPPPQQPYMTPFSANPHHPFEYESSVDDYYGGWQAASPRHQDPTTSSEATSCYVAADVLRTLKPDAGHELEQQLGCGNGVECQVNNSHIFELMDRYSEPGAR